MAVPDEKDNPTPPQHKRRNCSLVCVGVGVVFSCFGGLLLVIWPAVSSHVMAQILQLTPDSETYKSWVEPQVPNYMDFYFFNWTNPEDIWDPEKKLHFTEMGPYRFIEKAHKIDVVFNDNNTVTYKQVRYWFFDGENTQGSLSDYVTTADAIALSAAYINRDWNFVKSYGLNLLLQTRPMSVTKTISQMLFEGYSDRLLDLRNMQGGSEASAYDKYGLFYKRNGSYEHDGVFNVGTGVDNLSDIAIVKNWNFAQTTNFFSGSCDEIRGTTGERFPTASNKMEPIVIFSNSMCRSIDLPFEKEDVVEDILGYRYTAGANLFDNGTLDERNSCYCGGECVPSGVLNSSSCHENAPVFTSFPHFYLADPAHTEKIEGMRPDPARHNFYITVEPQTGIPLDVAGRLQINLLMQPYPMLSYFEQLPRLFFPVVWLDQRATITPELAASFRLLLMIPRFGQVAAVVLLVVGFGMLTIVILWHYRERRMRCKTKARNSFPMTAAQGS